MRVSKLAVAAMLIAALGAVPSAANPGRGHGNGPQAHHQAPQHGNRAAHRDRGQRFAGCPPGLAKKNPPCVPPGQARSQVRHGDRVGDVLRVGDFIVIRDPRRYDLPQRPGWDYYRDSDRIYRVDSTTRRVLAIQELIEAFSN
jgi:hypothetical protein